MCENIKLDPAIIRSDRTIMTCRIFIFDDIATNYILSNNSNKLLWTKLNTLKYQKI